MDDQDAGLSFDFAPDDASHPVDEDRLLLFIQGQLCATDAQEVSRFIATSRAWQAAWERLTRLPS